MPWLVLKNYQTVLSNGNTCYTFLSSLCANHNHNHITTDITTVITSWSHHNHISIVITSQPLSHHDHNHITITSQPLSHNDHNHITITSQSLSHLNHNNISIVITSQSEKRNQNYVLSVLYHVLDLIWQFVVTLVKIITKCFLLFNGFIAFYLLLVVFFVRVSIPVPSLRHLLSRMWERHSLKSNRNFH